MLNTYLSFIKKLLCARQECIQFVVFAIIIFFASHSISQPTGSATLFGRVAHTDAVGSSDITEEDDQNPLSVDFLGRLDYGRFQFLVEAEFRNNAPNHEHSSVERLKLGYLFNDTTQLWIGQFHNTGEYWLHEYHNGYYVKPSITNPFNSYTSYTGGITSKHLSGIRLDKQFILGEDAHQVKVNLTLADAPEVSGDESSISPEDFFTDFDSDNLMKGIKLAYYPDLFSSTSVGFSYSEGNGDLRNEDARSAGAITLKALAQGGADVSLLLPIQDQIFSGITLDVEHYGGFINYENDHGRILYSDSKIIYEIGLSPTVNEIAGAFITGLIGGGDDDLPDTLRFRYLHGEYHLNGKWSIFARREIVTSEVTQNRFISLLGQVGVEVDYDKNILGVRFDPVSNHAITVQYSDHDTHRDGREDNIHINWNFVLDWGF